MYIIKQIRPKKKKITSTVFGLKIKETLGAVFICDLLHPSGLSYVDFVSCIHLIHPQGLI